MVLFPDHNMVGGRGGFLVLMVNCLPIVRKFNFQQLLR